MFARVAIASVARHLAVVAGGYAAAAVVAEKGFAKHSADRAPPFHHHA